MSSDLDYRDLDVSLGPVVIHQEWMNRFTLAMMEEGSADNSLHLNENLARTKGLAATVIEGRMAVSLISRLLVRTFGQAWTAAGELEVRFRKMMLCESALTARMTYSGRECRDGRHVIRLDVWVESEQVDRPVTGTAWVPDVAP